MCGNGQLMGAMGLSLSSYCCRFIRSQSNALKYGAGTLFLGNTYPNCIHLGVPAKSTRPGFVSNNGLRANYLPIKRANNDYGRT